MRAFQKPNTKDQVTNVYDYSRNAKAPQPSQRPAQQPVAHSEAEQSLDFQRYMDLQLQQQQKKIKSPDQSFKNEPLLIGQQILSPILPLNNLLTPGAFDDSSQLSTVRDQLSSRLK